MSSVKVAFILGAGSRVGHHVSQAFAAKGYKIAILARSAVESESTDDQIKIKGDLADLASVEAAFEKVKKTFGVPPSVVVHNAGAATATAADDPLSVPLSAFTRDTAINLHSAFVAAQQATIGFKELPSSASRTFIYTGNILNTTVMPNLMDLGIGKSATAHLIESAATAYADKGFKFYYADERKPDGGAAFAISGEAHAKLFVELAEGESQGPWQQTEFTVPSQYEGDCGVRFGSNRNANYVEHFVDDLTTEQI